VTAEIMAGRTGRESKTLAAARKLRKMDDIAALLAAQVSDLAMGRLSASASNRITSLVGRLQRDWKAGRLPSAEAALADLSATVVDLLSTEAQESTAAAARKPKKSRRA
jgi:hypothetical protein